MKHCMQQIFRFHSILSNLYIYHLYHENHFSCFILHIKVFFYTCYLMLSVFFFLFLYTIWHKTLFQLHEDAVEYEEWEAGGHQLLSLVCLVVLVETWTLQVGVMGQIYYSQSCNGFHNHGEGAYILGDFNQEKAVFSVIVKTDGSFAALITSPQFLF